MLQDRSEAHHACSRTAHAVVDHVVVGGVGGGERIERPILLGSVEAESRLA